MNILHHLSPSAVSLIASLSGNIGILNVSNRFSRVFREAENFGRFVIQEYDSNGVQTDNSWLLLRDPSTDGQLVGFLRRQSKSLNVSYLFRAADQKDFEIVQNPDADEDKYEIGDRSVILESVRSPHSIFKQRW